MLLQCCQLTKTQASLFCETVQDIDSCFFAVLTQKLGRPFGYSHWFLCVPVFFADCYTIL